MRGTRIVNREAEEMEESEVEAFGSLFFPSERQANKLNRPSYQMKTKRIMQWGAALCTAFVAMAAPAAEKKPNFLILWGDDIGYWNLSAYNQGMMGYKTPNIDRIAKEGALFTDWYGQQSCTAGRS